MQQHSMNAVAFRLFGLDIYWYAIIIVSGIILAAILFLYSGKKYGWKKNTLEDVLIVALPSALVGARLYYVIFQWADYSHNLLEIFNTRNGGLAIYGGIIGGVLGAYIYCRIKKLDFFQLLDIAAPSIPLGQAIGRWGNFVNQEAFGNVVTNTKWQWFPASVFIEADGQYHYATFFYESFWCLIIVAVILALRKRFRHKGDAILTYFMLYGFERMIVEGFRTDSLYIGSLRVSQLLSGVLFIACALFFIIRAIREKGKVVLVTNVINPNYKTEEEEIADEVQADEVIIDRPRVLRDEILQGELGENNALEIDDTIENDKKNERGSEDE